MKFYLLVFCTVFALITNAKDLKVLMIGNSFSICVGRNLPQLVAHEGKHSIEITSAYIGGCSLKMHAENIRAAEKDSSVKPYDIDVWNSRNLKKARTVKGNINELLKKNKYDIITIQQASHESIDYNLCQPYADELIAYIKKYNPKAEIVIQQTWAYRADAVRLKHWKLTQQEMFAKVIASYGKLAEHTKFRIIPCGEAIDLARKSGKYDYKVLSRKQLAKFTYPDLPPRASDPVGKHIWQKTKKVQRWGVDSIHLNEHGEYLQACVWYAFLFNEDAEKITYEEQLPLESCIVLRRCAAQAIKKYQK